jgi:hypothetical protein
MLPGELYVRQEYPRERSNNGALLVYGITGILVFQGMELPRHETTMR